MDDFLTSWSEAALTSLGFFWMALWAFALGYLISSLIQVLVTRERMQDVMGDSGPRSVALGAFFGFISSSCSFAALATTRALLKKGAGLVPALSFMLASTNLVIELGIVIGIFLGWQFVVGEYVGGLLLILLAWSFVSLTRPRRLLRRVRDRLSDDRGGEGGENDRAWKQKLTSLDGWREIAKTYVMEWRMVWKDVLIGFTVAGAISAFVPRSFFEALFPGAGAESLGFWQVLVQTIVGPVAAFFTFIGSMGNIPLASLLFDRGVSFAGAMAFIFSDLVVLPVLRINARYYGWRMALYILALLLTCLVVTSLVLHYGFLALGVLPEPGSGAAATDRDFFELNYGFVLNVIFLATSGALGWLWWGQREPAKQEEEQDVSWSARILQLVTALAIVWLCGGLLVRVVG